MEKPTIAIGDVHGQDLWRDVVEAHPERAVYLLGSETDGLSPEALEHCADVVQIPGEFSLNVSVAGSIVLYDRLLKNGSFGV